MTTSRRTARTGGDPLADRRRAQGMPTFEEAAGQVLAIHQTAWKESGRMSRFWESTLRDYVYPHIGGKSVDPGNDRGRDGRAAAHLDAQSRNGAEGAPAHRQSHVVGHRTRLPERRIRLAMPSRRRCRDVRFR